MAPTQSVPWPTIEQVQRCDNYEQVMRWQRRLPSPQTGHQQEVVKAVTRRWSQLKARNPSAMVAASKAVGW